MPGTPKLGYRNQRHRTPGDNLFFTPFPREPVGWMIEQCGEDLFLFSSDYPHPEGTKDPIQRFEETMDGVSAPAREAFYSGNYAAMMGL